ncbi:hypothetical protein, partial [Klebsiella quasipneumoniae]|uniref:hypothetical protein n=1 Tax=Klebsiella quasipneumoniae TaxID=1463165 RepID=UPI00272F17A9
YSAAYYVFKKYIYDFQPCTGVVKELTVDEGDWKTSLKEFFEFESVKGKPVYFFLYPNKKESEGSVEISTFEGHAAD